MTGSSQLAKWSVEGFGAGVPIHNGKRAFLIHSRSEPSLNQTK